MRQRPHRLIVLDEADLNIKGDIEMILDHRLVAAGDEYEMVLSQARRHDGRVRDVRSPRPCGRVFHQHSNFPR